MEPPRGGGEMTVQEMIQSYLKEHGYDGLYCDGCGCLVDDLFPCCGGEWAADCKAGYKTLGDDPEEESKQIWIVGPTKAGDEK